MVLKKRNVNNKNTQLKPYYNKAYVKDTTQMNEYNEDYKKEEKNETRIDNCRKKKLYELSKVINIKNTKKHNCFEFNEKIINSKSKLKKKIISDSSCSEDNTIKKNFFVEKIKYENDFDDDKNIFSSNNVENSFNEENEVSNTIITDKNYNEDLQINKNFCSKKYISKDFVKNNDSTEMCNEEDESKLLFSFIKDNIKNDMADKTLCESSINRNNIKTYQCNKNSSNTNSFDETHMNKNNYDKINSNVNLFSENESNENNLRKTESDVDFRFSGKKKNKKNKIISSSENSKYISDYSNLYENSHETDLSYDNSDGKKKTDEYALHLKIFNEQNLDDDYFSFNSLSIKKSIRLYIEFITLSLLSPNFQYKVNYFKVSENTKKVVELLKLNYSNIHKELEKKKFLEEYYNKSDSTTEGLKNNKKKKKKNLKRLFEHDSDSQKNKESYNQSHFSNFMLNQEKMKKKKKKKYIISDGSSLSNIEYSYNKKINLKDENNLNMNNSEKSIEENYNEKFEIKKLEKDKKEEIKEKKQQHRQKVEYDYEIEKEYEDDDEKEDDNDEDENEEDDNDEDENEEDDNDEDEYENDEEDENEDENDVESEDKEYEYDIFGNSKKEKEYSYNNKMNFKKKIMKDINDSFMYNILNDEILKIYEFLKNEEKFSNYDFLKMICKISKNKSKNYYDRCIQKIENKILSKRDQFESHPFQTSFKNILKNYANIFIFYLEYNKICCSCCNRKLTYACPVFFIKPFYNSADLWNNCFFNFMRVNNFGWLGKLYFNNFSNPIDILKNEENDELKMKKIKESNKLFIKNQNEKRKKDFLQINKSNSNNATVLQNEKYILNHIKESENFNSYRYTNMIEGRRLKKKRKELNFNNFYFKGEREENSINLIMENICENFCNLSENYIEKDILVLQLGSYCVSSVYYWHVFHHYKFFITKIIYITSLGLYKKNKDLFKEPLLLAYVISKKLYKKLYEDFKVLMNIDISQIKNKLDECDLFIK
ncbi:conserved Plasmodium protein, unknown function [Plasmodium gallinaceum]|uniref:DUF4211 domain-containing protein n=1 Tax=Plasmodium gallinaceum TaxID=5849 RepID=A0A1J1GN79_PLAGA|nr:conserved Plasmodium protein, unknown function [Plasmodium gallinaceum]CRG93929.1 conserved Plasmodium protein, unknown function [Plasmodium gallinaceum]